MEDRVPRIGSEVTIGWLFKARSTLPLHVSCVTFETERSRQFVETLKSAAT
ncbi:hypothetical protein M1L60_13340 [Actinoplanes sp. TRM 88003]|uniref:Uncharacterized protein n=1 Tax=Paractinoplanes aksuensis TaxID=2939490 RepID=A0ABT1DL62_9ACTN|nr:hypothetical protein [Actinoplanes aksuensis]MCO8271578.1 hypothetical protein [Actinoplanes aksuensis]